MGWEQIVDKKMNQDYVGHAESADWTFTVPLPDQLGAQYIADNIIQAHIEELALENSLLLELRVWVDKSPTFETLYYVEVVATASPLFWGMIIGGVLLILSLVALSFILIKTEDIVTYIGEKSPGTLPLMAIAAIGVVAIGVILIVKR